MKKSGQSGSSKTSGRDSKALPPGDNDEESVDDPADTSHHHPEIEDALPPIASEEEALAEYEAFRSTQNTRDDGNEEAHKPKWERGRSSIYVDAFNLALDTVLEDETHLFDEKEQAVFDAWKSLDYEAQYLLVFITLRRPVPVVYLC